MARYLQIRCIAIAARFGYNRKENVNRVNAMDMLQDYLDQLFDVFNVGVCVTDAQGTVLFLNAMHEKLTGVPHDSMIGHNIQEFVGRGVFDVILNPEILRTGKSMTRVQTLANGRRLVLDGHPIFDRDHTAAFCITLIRDESSLQELQGKVKFQKELLEVFSKLSGSSKQESQMPEIVQSGTMIRLQDKIRVLAQTDSGGTGYHRSLRAVRGQSLPSLVRQLHGSGCPKRRADRGSLP